MALLPDVTADTRNRSSSEVRSKTLSPLRSHSRCPVPATLVVKEKMPVLVPGWITRQLWLLAPSSCAYVKFETIGVTVPYVATAGAARYMRYSGASVTPACGTLRPALTPVTPERLVAISNSLPWSPAKRTSITASVPGAPPSASA
jgi:hypothetical protein